MKVKLSEALLMLGMTKPQGFGSPSTSSIDAPCAIGGALQVIGRQSANPSECLRTFTEAWPWVDESRICPAGGCDWALCDAPTRLIIWHLNDHHKWSRAQIAEWVASIEPAEPMHIGTELSELMDQVTKTVEQCICKGCGKFDDKCICTIPYGDEFRASLEDDPARQR